jgi:hypothetical protein
VADRNTIAEWLMRKFMPAPAPPREAFMERLQREQPPTGKVEDRTNVPSYFMDTTSDRTPSEKWRAAVAAQPPINADVTQMAIDAGFFDIGR